jgi:uncharacterized protein YdhG (YjbR/CyaY superfamily)
LNQLQDELKGYVVSTGSMQFAIDKPLPKTLLKKLIKIRLDEIKFGKLGKAAK